ncbi:unnamed protein product, partial [marine sediment metagenome]
VADMARPYLVQAGLVNAEKPERVYLREASGEVNAGAAG